MEGAATAAASSAVVVEEERLDVVNKTEKEIVILLIFLLFLFFGNVEEKFIEMEITTEQFTCGCTPKARKNCFFNVAPIARIPGQANGISQAPAIFLLAILHLCPLSERELQEELGISLPKDAFELIFIYLQECVINDGKFINNEFNDVYLVTTVDPIPLEAFTLQETEVSAVKYISFEEYRSLLVKEDPDYVPYDVDEQYGHLFEIIRRRYTKQYLF
ncbi:hypothetical protein POTOM_014462 [Populus tomentosa]|uniref:Nudix hydrolase domain-containing protein n=1 Tax=Populus tomentosa TaxID=118781 RepID=A0A8X8CZD4_POPTO|nr:hypothetical protein POTOM_014462 [Populus tomentosa]